MKHVNVKWIATIVILTIICHEDREDIFKYGIDKEGRKVALCIVCFNIASKRKWILKEKAHRHLDGKEHKANVNLAKNRHNARAIQVAQQTHEMNIRKQFRPVDVPLPETSNRPQVPVTYYEAFHDAFGDEITFDIGLATELEQQRDEVERLQEQIKTFEHELVHGTNTGFDRMDLEDDPTVTNVAQEIQNAGLSELTAEEEDTTSDDSRTLPPRESQWFPYENKTVSNLSILKDCASRFYRIR